MSALSLKSIGVVFGGVSDEHNVSIKSARTVVSALREGDNLFRYKAIPIYIDPFGIWHDESVSEKVLINDKCENKVKGDNANFAFDKLPINCESIDIWYPVLHGPNGEDGSIQGFFRLSGKPFVGANVLGSALAMDKLATKAIFKSLGLSQVPYISINANDFANEYFFDELDKEITSSFLYPCFIKPANLGSSLGITKAIDKSELIKGLKRAASHDERIVIEKAVAARELECAVIGRTQMKTSVVGEIKHNSEWYDYETKYSEGASKCVIPADLPKGMQEKIKEISLLACKALAVYGMARVDFFYDDDKNQLWINEINTLPGFTSQSMYPLLWAASGLKLDELVAQLVETANC